MLRTGLWLPLPKKEQNGDGIKIVMLVENKLKEMKVKDPKYFQEIAKFSKNEYRKTNKYK